MKKYPRLKKVKNFLYWQDSQFDNTGKRPTTPLGRIDDPKAMVRYWDLEKRYQERPDTLNWVLTQFEIGFLGDSPGDQGGRKVRRLAPKTKKNYLGQLPALRNAFGSMKPNHVNRIMIGEFLDQHPSPVSANRQIALLSRIYTWAIRRGWASHNPCAKVERNEEEPRDCYVFDHEYSARKKNATPKIAAVMDLIYITGMRLSDILNIHLNKPLPDNESQVWLDTDALFVKPRKTRHKRPMTVRYEREGLLEIVTQRLLKLNSQNDTPGVYLVTNNKGRPYTVDGFETLWRRLAQQDKHEFTLHDIRAKSATDAEEQELNPQILLGHVDEKTTERYLRTRRIYDAKGPVSDIVTGSKPAKIVPFKKPTDDT